jgi:hypothetical protein
VPIREIRGLFRLQLREQNHVVDAYLAEQHHAQGEFPSNNLAGDRKKQKINPMFRQQFAKIAN